jgi:hypothetical protein
MLGKNLKLKNPWLMKLYPQEAKKLKLKKKLKLIEHKTLKLQYQS